MAPWIASIWAEESSRLWLWASGLLIDLTITAAATSRRNPDRSERHGPPDIHSVPPRKSTGPGPSPTADYRTTARIDPEHLAERLGLFTLIVLGEGVYQLVDAASDTRWNRDLYLTAPAAFLTLTLVWSLSLRRGHNGIPFLSPHVPASGTILVLHCCTTGALAGLAVGLGTAIAHSGGPLPASNGWIMAVERRHLPPRRYSSVPSHHPTAPDLDGGLCPAHTGAVCHGRHHRRFRARHPSSVADHRVHRRAVHVRTSPHTPPETVTYLHAKGLIAVTAYTAADSRMAFSAAQPWEERPARQARVDTGQGGRYRCGRFTGEQVKVGLRADHRDDRLVGALRRRAPGGRGRPAGETRRQRPLLHRRRRDRGAPGGGCGCR